MISEIRKEILSNIEKEMIISQLTKGKRIDGRGLFDFRKINVIPAPVEKAEGSAFVSLGKTKVLVGIKVNPAMPFPDTPNEGIFVINTEFSPVASPLFELGPPSEYAIEVARVVDRIIRSSEMIKLDELVIIPGELVWMINIDIYALDDNGNLIDASLIGTLAALYVGYIPRVEVIDKDRKKIEIIKEERTPIPLKDMPISFTFAKIKDILLLDPTRIEENIMDARLTIAVNNKGEICSVQKGEGGGFKLEDIHLAKDIVIKKSNGIRKIINDQLVKKPRGKEAWNEIRRLSYGEDEES